MPTSAVTTSFIDGTPEKNIFRGMIADYDLRTGLCELIDNALDLWTDGGCVDGFRIDVGLDAGRQVVTVGDNAGGVREQDLRLLVAPGASRERSGADVIGIFGVGGKRAGVALGELVEIRTRHGRGGSFRIDIDSDWLQSEGWEIGYAPTPKIDPGSTVVEISKLRQPFVAEDIERIRGHLAETYGLFIARGCTITLNGAPVAARSFDVWSYPPSYPPRTLAFSLRPEGTREMAVAMEAGLIGDRDAEAENYGVYVYCNDRLIVKEMREREVGYFVTGEAGVPHPDASLCRVIVRLRGDAELMPWNSSKSGVNIAHPSFTGLRSNIIALVTYYSKLSRRLRHSWEEDVFSYPSGTAEPVDPEEVAAGARLILPKLPRARRVRYVDAVRQLNAGVMERQPHTIGLVEAMGMVDVLARQRLETRNRAALILLDSNFEIALKEFIVHDHASFPPRVYNDTKIKHVFSQRTTVIREVQAKVPRLTADMVTKANHYYGLRNKLIHERTMIPISDREVADYRSLIESVLRILFSLRFPVER